jgi:hypothetical protein
VELPHSVAVCALDFPVLHTVNTDIDAELIAEHLRRDVGDKASGLSSSPWESNGLAKRVYLPRQTATIREMVDYIEGNTNYVVVIAQHETHQGAAQDIRPKDIVLRCPLEQNAGSGKVGQCLPRLGQSARPAQPTQLQYWHCFDAIEK